MSLLGSLFASDAVKKAAFSGLRKLMDDENLSCIVLRNNPSNVDGFIPGFDVDLFKKPVSIYDANVVGITREQFEDYTALKAIADELVEKGIQYGRIAVEQLQAWADPEVQDIINRYLKAKKLKDDNHTTSEPGNADTATSEAY